MQNDMIDFPVSWTFHRHYQQEFGFCDPGDNEPKANIQERLDSLEAEIKTRPVKFIYKVPILLKEKRRYSKEEGYY